MWPETDCPLNIAHRGASTIAPENTLAAFKRALEVGADGIELDVQLSADGVPVVIHDATVDATTDGSGRVCDLALNQLKRLDAGSSFDAAFAAERIPTLAEVLEAFGEDLLLNVELKSMSVIDRGLERAVVELISEHGLEHRVLLSSFNPFALRRVQLLAPHIATGLLYAYPPQPLLRLISVIMPRRNTALHPFRAVADEEHVSWVQARHLRVHVWTVDDPEDMRRLATWGVDGMITNRPRVLREVLDDAS